MADVTARLGYLQAGRMDFDYLIGSPLHPLLIVYTLGIKFTTSGEDLAKFGSEGMLGSAVALSLIRELGPVLTALMVTGRAITAEIGIMKITEQIDALRTMALEPFKYLVAPKVLASLIALPLLCAIFDVVGIFGGYLVGVKLLGVNPGAYMHEMVKSVEWKDVYSGIIKSISFGLIISWVCCYKGYYAGHGAEGVSRATTSGVVMSSVLVLIWDYFITSVLM